MSDGRYKRPNGGELNLNVDPISEYATVQKQLPEHKLSLRCLILALRCACKGNEEDLEWLNSDDDSTYPFTFLNLCLLTGFSPKPIREAVKKNAKNFYRQLRNFTAN